MNPSSGGEAPGTIVRTHGFQDTAALWDGVIARLCDRRWRACSVDLAFADGTDAIRRGAILEAYRDQVLDVLEHVNPTARCPVVVVGHSMGSQIAELVAAARPDVAVGLALVAPVPLAGYALPPARAAQFDEMTRDRNAASVAKGRRALLSNTASSVVQDLVSATLATPPVTAVQQLRAWTAGHPFGDHPSVVSAPVQLIGGGEDPILLDRTDSRSRGTPIRRRAHRPGGPRRPLASRRTTRCRGPASEALPVQAGRTECPSQR
jgi:pimeloyl-ACP methyl ester carboxylesterase